MKLQVVLLSLVVLAGLIQTGYSCCRKDDSNRCTLLEKIGIIKAALKNAKCIASTEDSCITDNSCKCHKEPLICTKKPFECPIQKSCACQQPPVKPVCPPQTPSCPLTPVKTCCQCQNTPKPCVPQTPICLPAPIVNCQDKVPACPAPTTTPKPCVPKVPVCHQVPVCPVSPPKTCACHQVPVSVCPHTPPKTCCCHQESPAPIKIVDCHDNVPTCPAPTTSPKSCVPKVPVCHPVTVCPHTTPKTCACHQEPAPVCSAAKNPCEHHLSAPCTHHMVIPIANVSNIFANSMFLGIPCKQHCQPKTTTITTTTTCAPPPEPTCYVCVPCKGKKCDEIVNKMKCFITGGVAPCVVCED